ncbi:MAG: hypothetical protein MN733_33290 [Nitrososphaera sp.]|nr:hypothetical protein [Nitrososphaera sp.]
MKCYIKVELPDRLVNFGKVPKNQAQELLEHPFQSRLYRRIQEVITKSYYRDRIDAVEVFGGITGEIRFN